MCNRSRVRISSNILETCRLFCANILEPGSVIGSLKGFFWPPAEAPSVLREPESIVCKLGQDPSRPPRHLKQQQPPFYNRSALTLRGPCGDTRPSFFLLPLIPFVDYSV